MVSSLLSRFQDMDEEVKIARGDDPVKEQLYSGETLICSCSAEQGETFELSSCPLRDSQLESDLVVDAETIILLVSQWWYP